MRRTLVAAIAALALAAPASAEARVTGPCESVGDPTPDGWATGTCQTDMNGGTGSATFTGGGYNVELAARSRRGPQEVAAFWQSDGPIAATTVCVETQVWQLRTGGRARVTGRLVLSYDHGSQQESTPAVLSEGHYRGCLSVPAGSTDVWWQYLLDVDTGKPGRLRAVVSITHVDLIA